jgi:predicted RNA binding protein YcfA (HicA-like mRNA interferase family)
MPKLRRLTGREVVTILQSFGFQVVRIRGSHHQMQRMVDEQNQTLIVPVHGSKPIARGTLKSIYRQACDYIPEKDLKPHFYGK